MIKNDKDIEAINDQLLKATGGMFMVMPAPPIALFPTITTSLWHYWGMTKGSQRNLQLAKSIQGRYGMYVLQSSHGKQQIKLYQPWLYKNDVNTPLRIRARKIMQIASQEPKELRKKKVKELYRTYPYHLLISDPIKLRMKNFYFDKSVMSGDMIKFYRALNPDNPDPSSDPLYIEKEYGEKKTVAFAYEDMNEQYYYAVNIRNNGSSNLLHFVWQEDIEFAPTTEKKPDKWAEAAKIFNSGGISEERSKVTFGNSVYAKDFYRAKKEAEQAEKPNKQPSLDYRQYINNLGHIYYYQRWMQKKHEKLVKAGFFGVKKKE